MAAARYEIVRQLACGGMAEVLLARRTGGDGERDLVVIKRVLPHLSQAEGFMRMFATESRIASQLQHPNIVSVVEVGEMDSLPFIAMERLDGADLLRLLQQCVLRRQQLGSHVAMAIVAGAARGLGYAHRARARDGRPLKIIHRDVSPHNIFVTREGGVKLLDFGIAKSAAQAGHTSTGQVKGKISYMSPEQIRAKPLTARSDLWSLGVVLWESVAGEKLFTRDNDAATLHAILHDPIPRLHRADAPALDDLIAQVLDRDPDRRIGTAEEIAQRLEQLLAQAGQTSLSRLMAQRVASLVPALSPEIDAVKPALTRNPEVVTFAVGPAFSHPAGPDQGGPHRKVGVSAARPSRPAPRDEEDPTLLEIAAPPPDRDFDADETIDRHPDRPLVGENTDTHTIPMPHPIAATGTGGQHRAPTPIARQAPFASSAPLSVPSRRATQMFTGPSAAPLHEPAPPSARVVMRDDFDDSLTSEIHQVPVGAAPVAPLARPQMPRATPARPPAPKPLPPPIAEKPRTMPPPRAKPLAAAVQTRPGVGSLDGPESPPARPMTMPPRPPPAASPVQPEPRAAPPAYDPDLDVTRPAPPAARPTPPAPDPLKRDVSDPDLALRFGDLPPNAAPAPLFAEPPPARPPAPLAMPRGSDTLDAAEVSSTVQRPTMPIPRGRSPWRVAAALGGLGVVASLVVGGAYIAGGLRARDTAGTATSVLRPTESPASPPVAPAPAVVQPAVAPAPLPVVAPAPAPVVAAAPPPVVAPAPPVAIAPTPAPPAAVIAPPPPPVIAPPPAVVAPRAPVQPAATVARVVRPVQPVAAPRPRPAAPHAPLPDPFDAPPTRVVTAPSTTRTPTRPTVAPPARPAIPAPTHRPSPTVRGGGIFTDL